MQVSQEAGQVVWYSYLFQNFAQFIVIHTIKGFGIVNKAEIDVFLELSCFFDDPADVGNLITLMAESEEELKSLLMKSERGEWKSWLKAQHSETKIMASGSISSWEIDGETVETVSGFILGGSKITADGDCSHEIQRHLLLGKELWPT